MITKEELEILQKVKKIFSKRCSYYDSCCNCELCEFCENAPADWNFSEIGKEFIITKEEYTILNNFELFYKQCYIFRNELDDIYISKEKPFIKNNELLVRGGEFLKISMFNHLFKTIRYEDEEPKKIIDYIEEYEKCQNKTEKK